jgi:acyl-CoA hydrolase
MPTMTRQREATLRFFAEPGDVNFYGKVFGGAVMKWIDLAGYACAAGWCGSACVTVYVGGIRFYKPVLIGHMIEVRAKLIHTGRTSMHMAVDVRSRDPQVEGDYTHTTHCVIVFVAIDAAGNTITVPAWDPVTDEDKALQQYALKLHAMNKSIEGEMKPYLGV